jgi:hypothetical protein
VELGKRPRELVPLVSHIWSEMGQTASDSGELFL